MQRDRGVACLLGVWLLAAPVAAQSDPAPVVGHEGCVITTPPPELGLDPFYQKYCSAGGLPILGSVLVPDQALYQAWNIVMNMISFRPQIQDMIVAQGTRVGVIAQSEVVTDLPEYRDLYVLWPDVDWDSRARGLGATPFKPLSSAAEENLLCYPSDPYLGESIMVHEFAHTVLTMGLDFVDPSFRSRLDAAYAQAMAAGLWSSTYAATNPEEYWAEGVQDYFDTNLERDPPDGIHNHVDTRQELLEYDPGLYALIAETFPALPWTPVCPAAP